MPVAHRHDDIEVNLAAGGGLTYLLGGTWVRVEPDRLAAFWAAVPHQLVDVDPGVTISWLTVPISTFLTWPISDSVRVRLLQGRPLTAEADSAALMRLRRWEDDLADGPDAAERRDVALLEIEAWMRRLARVTGPGWSAQSAADVRPRASTAAAMAAFIAAHATEPIGVAEVAAAVSLHPRYAMAVFKDSLGTSIGRYLTQCRVAEVQRLLISTDHAVTDIGYLAGFSSQSRFYAAFRDVCRAAPAAYRRAHQR
jgi:AraC-like DNA-binding protein